MKNKIKEMKKNLKMLSAGVVSGILLMSILFSYVIAQGDGEGNDINQTQLQEELNNLTQYSKINLNTKKSIYLY